MRKLVTLTAIALSACSVNSEPGSVTTTAPTTTTAAPEVPTSTTEAPTTTVEVTTTTEAPVTPSIPTTTRFNPVTTTIVKVFTSQVGPVLAYGEWAIPAYIVMCESQGQWDAINPSGASGPYQLMPLHFGGELAMNQSRSAQHAKAAQLWNGGEGRYHWAACL